jgi:iron complex outermembrane receptor protein
LFCATTVPLVGTLNYESWTYRGGVEFDVSPQSLLYGGVSTGFKSGGFFAAPAPNTFRPEKLTSYEVGWKNRLLDNRLQLNVETFYWDYKDHQETHLAPSSIPGFFVFATENAGRATLYGADLDTAFLFTPTDRINLKVQYEHSVYDEFRYSHPTAAFGPPSTGCSVGPFVNGSQTVDCKGFQVVRAPEWSGTAGYDHTFRIGNGGSIIAGAQAQFASSSWLSIDFLPQLKQDSYTVFDVDLRYVAPADKWSVSAFVHNVGNEAVLTQGFHYPFTSPANPLAPGGLYFATIRPPRTYGAQVRINF